MKKFHLIGLIVLTVLIASVWPFSFSRPQDSIAINLKQRADTPLPLVGDELKPEHKRKALPRPDLPSLGDEAKPEHRPKALPGKELPFVQDEKKPVYRPKTFPKTNIPELSDEQKPEHQTPKLPTAPIVQVADDKFGRGEFLFDGQWLPSVDAAKIGAKNYSTLKNLRYTKGDRGLEGIRGFSKINASKFYVGGQATSGTTVTEILLRGEGTHAGTVIVDSSDNAHGNMNPYGTVITSTTQNKFGSASIFGDGDGDYADYLYNDTDLSDLLFAGNKFTIDFWTYIVDPAQQTGFFSFGSDNTNAYYALLYEPEEQLLVFYYNNAISLSVPDVIYITGSWVPKANTWYHIAVVRGWSSNANDFAITVDGTSVGTGTDATSMVATDSRAGLRVLTGDVWAGYGTDGFDVDWGTLHFAIERAQSQVSKDTAQKKFGTGSYKKPTGVSYAFNVRVWFNGSQLNMTFGNSYAIEAFIKLGDHAGFDNIISLTSGGNTALQTGGWRFWHEHGVGLRFTTVSGSNPIDMTGAAGEITDTNWHHIAAIIMADGSTGLYLDGTQVAHDTYDNFTQVAATSDLHLAGHSNTSYQKTYFGWIDEARIYFGDPYSAAPDAGLTDTITVPTAVHKTDANTRLLLHGDPYYLNGYVDEFRMTTGALWTANFSIISGPPTSMIQLQSPYTTTSYVLMAGHNDAAGESGVIQNKTAIPSAGEFEATLHENVANASRGRFSHAPNGNIAYSNSKETAIWSGDEMRIGAFLTSTAAVTASTLTNPKDYTEKVNNGLLTTSEIVTIGGQTDTFTELLLHADEADAGTTIVDSSASSHTISPLGDAQADDAQSKWGNSVYFDGTGDYFTAPDHADWATAAGDFTVDFWVNMESSGAARGFFGQWVDANNYIEGYYLAGFFYFYVIGSSTPEADYYGYRALVVGEWTHIEYVRNGTSFYIFVNGKALTLTTTTAIAATSLTDFAAVLTIGNGNNAARPMTGWLDEFRWSKGIARHTADFSLPNSPYGTTAKDFLIGAVRPLQGVKFYIANPNLLASTLTMKEWNGNSWSSVTITDNTDTGASLAATGTVTWTSTVDTSRPKFIEGRFLYWYQFNIDAADAAIYQVTADAPFQKIKDIWDGVYRQPFQFQVFDNAIYEDYTLEVNADSSVDGFYVGVLDDLADTEHIIVMFEDRLAVLKWIIPSGKGNGTASVVTIYYWSGEAWVSVGDVTDTTLDDAGGTKSLNQTGAMSWSPPTSGEEFEQTLFDKTGYAYKIVFSVTLDSEVEIDRLTGVPAPLDLDPVKYTALYKNRLLRMAFKEGGEGNRVDFSTKYTSDAWNGEDSSLNGVQSLYFGGTEELNGAVQVFNRYGSNIFTVLMACKDRETYILTGDYPRAGPDTFRILSISKNIGCPAPETLVAAEVGLEVVVGVKANVAIWMDYSGPVMFDGSTIHPITGIEKYFDPTDSEAINYSYMESSHAFYDPLHSEYNLLFPSGSSQTTINKWLVYDLISRKWYEKVPDNYPSASVDVADTDGARYNYAGLNTGFMMRLDNGNTWADTAITSTVETGDFYPTKSMWDQTRIRRHKIIATDITETTRTVAITHYADTSTSGTSLTALDLDSGTNRISRLTQSTNLLGWAHRFKYSTSTLTTGPDLGLFGWGYLYRTEREDL